MTKAPPTPSADLVISRGPSVYIVTASNIVHTYLCIYSCNYYFIKLQM